MRITWENPEGYQPHEVDSFCAQADTVDGFIGTRGLTTFSAFKSSLRKFAQEHGAAAVRIISRTNEHQIDHYV